MYDDLWPRPDDDLITLEWRAVDILDALPTLRSPASRQLLVTLVERQLGRPVPAPDLPISRQWFLGLVEACRVLAGGMDALAVAVERLEPAHPAVRALREVCGRWTVRSGQPVPGGTGSGGTGSGGARTATAAHEVEPVTGRETGRETRDAEVPGPAPSRRDAALTPAETRALSRPPSFTGVGDMPG